MITIAQKTTITGFLFAVSLSQLAIADEIRVEPGLWKTTTTNYSPFTPQPVTIDHEECIAKDKALFTPETMAQELGEKCKVLNSNVSGSLMQFSLQCEMNGQTMNAQGNFTIESNHSNGEVKMEINMQGQKIEMRSTFDSKRVGECSAN